MPDVALPEGTLSAERIWKRFRAERQRMLLRDDIQRLGRRRPPGERYRWALRDVSLEAAPGDSIGLVGANGSGKSTLLKILTGVMYPEAGRLQVSGRVGALIEVRAGIHPDLTGRENIFLYGRLLGLSRADVARRFDRIVEFAELEGSVERQVKFYSMGMQMRLGFSVAAFLEPDILLVDEVLSVGDATFQQRCLERMRAVLDQGITLVYVSHDLATVEATCARTLWLHQGVVRAHGPTAEVLSRYRAWIEDTIESGQSSGGPVRVARASAGGGDDGVRTGGLLQVTAVLEAAEPHVAVVCLGVSEGPASPIFVLRHDVDLRAGETRLGCEIRSLPLPRGRYYVWIGVYARPAGALLAWHPVAAFEVTGPGLDPVPPGIARLAPVHVGSHWSYDHQA